MWGETEDEARLRTAQARCLKAGARKGGLRFEAYLPPDLAVWVLEKVERGEFFDPSEAVFAILLQARDIDGDEAIQTEILRRRINKGLQDVRKDAAC
jgi:Arc/MetJ-type ribon-helix-helix transcriptional regulator